MIITPKARGFVCTTAHPVGCGKAVLQEIDYVKKHGQFTGPKNVLIIGASTGYGLATRIAAAFGAGAKTIGVFFERPATEKRTASAGWYNTAACEKQANAAGLYAKSINGDAFSHEIKQQTLELIKQDLGTVDLVVYSLASPKRKDPDRDVVYSSVLKTVAVPYSNKTVNPLTGEVKDIRIGPATDEEIAATVAVMGGDDWRLWIDALQRENLLSPGVKTVAYSYIGPVLTHPIYKDGSIGKAKQHLQQTSKALNAQLASLQGEAAISVNKAVVTQASAAIPIVPLYISLLFKIMKAKGLHEGCIEQMTRLLKDQLYGAHPTRDDTGRIRLDDLEMRADVQEEVCALWQQVKNDNIEEISDINGYRDDFFKLFGFGLTGVDYTADVDQQVNIASIDLAEVN